MIGLGAFLASGGFVARPEKSWTGLIGGVFLLVAAWYVVRRMARSPWWNVRHRQALVSGTLLTCAWLGFFVTWLLWPEDRRMVRQRVVRAGCDCAGAGHGQADA
ncbi:hypothetical protein [Thermobacillus sp.]|uniref:hypothetical protein n=1 Tax=Thermobacillus sp. TaxID=2108467 RepID=UPI00257B66D2|nr:hypothetical protein [Thermobacillus sp.]